ncbi:hypothetical protein [Cohnella sp.]|uniref:hypothetical protein n=1 Tax=Cohnella sp. TaxID=1883426 RepID=UPI0037040C54
MSKRNTYILAVLLVAIVVVLAIMNNQRNTTFKEAVLDHLNLAEISSVDVIKSIDSSEEEISVTTPEKIQFLMNVLSEVKLRKADYSNSQQTESYWITIKTNNERKFGLTLYSDHIIVFSYDSVGKKSVSYKILNHVDLEAFNGLF